MTEQNQESQETQESQESQENRIKGTVKWFNTSKGYGFISREEGEDVFVHHSEIRGEGFKNLNEGEQVEFGVVDTPKGPRATDVKKVGGTTFGPTFGGEDSYSLF
jgi:CspA family cold shock protein